MTRFTPSPGCSQSSREIFLLSHSPPPPCCLWHRSRPALQPGAAYGAKFGQLGHPKPSLNSWELGRAAGCSQAPFILFAAGHSQILGKGWIWGHSGRGVLLCQQEREAGMWWLFSPHHPWVDSAGTDCPCVILSISSPRIPNYPLLPA